MRKGLSKNDSDGRRGKSKSDSDGKRGKSNSKSGKSKSDSDDMQMGKGIPEHAKLQEGGDIDEFLSSFEDHMKTFRVRSQYWVANLAPLLAEHARSMYWAMPRKSR